MATSGSFSSSFGTNSKYYIILEWTRNWVDIASNTSNVTVRAYLQSGGSSYTINSSAVKYGTMHINGTDYSFSFYCGLSGNQKKEIYSQTVNIAHNSDGTKSFWMSVSGNIGISFSSGKVNTVSTSGTGTLDSIPRTSSISLSTSTATLGSTTVTVNISRASTSFTHNVRFNYGNQSVSISSNAATSCSFVPNISLSSQTPNGTQGWGEIVVDTYNGGTYIGTASAGLTCYVPASVKPSFTSLGAETVAAGADTSYGYVQGMSKCKLSIWGAAGSYGSTITQCVITGLGSTWYQWQITTGTLNTAGSITFSAYVVDSRGRASDTKTCTINVQPYSPPYISGFYIARCLSTGTESDSGTYLKVWNQCGYSSLSGKNTITLKAYYKKSNTASWSSAVTTAHDQTVILGGGGISTSDSYDVKIEVADKFKTVTRSGTVKPQFITLDFKAGGKGIAIGKQATGDIFDIDMDTEFSQPVKHKQGTWVYSCGQDGATGHYVKIANMTVTATWFNGCLCFGIIQRGRKTVTKLYIGFSGNEQPVDSSVSSFIREGAVDAYIVGNNGAFDLYIGSLGTWDVFEVVDYSTSPYLSGVKVTWTKEIVNAVPSPYIAAQNSPAGHHWSGQSPMIGTDGVMEIGKYIDFHTSNEGTSDYDGRISSAGWAFLTNLAWVPVMNGTVNLGDGNYRWSTVYSVAGVNASSDRSLKENIKYVNSKARSADQITYSDMYNFVKDDLGLAEYNYKNDEKKDKKLNFIAQDLLVNADGSDNVVGQMIVKPVAVPTKQEIKEAKAKLEEGQTYEYPTLSYDINTYVSVLAGALKEAIFKIEELTIKIEELESKVSDDDDIHDC